MTTLTTTLTTVIYSKNITDNDNHISYVTIDILVCSGLVIFLILYIMMFCYKIANNGSNDHYLIENRLINKRIIYSHINSGIISTTKTNNMNINIYSNDTCSICLSNINLNESVRTLPCNHYYHKKCIDPWIFTNYTCPLCKLHLIDNIVNGNIIYNTQSYSNIYSDDINEINDNNNNNNNRRQYQTLNIMREEIV